MFKNVLTKKVDISVGPLNVVILKSQVGLCS